MLNYTKTLLGEMMPQQGHFSLFVFALLGWREKMDQQKLTQCLREIGAELVTNGKALKNGSFVGTAVKHFASEHKVQTTDNVEGFFNELSMRLWKTGRLRIHPEPQEVITFLLKRSGLNDQLLISRIVH